MTNTGGGSALIVANGANAEVSGGALTGSGANSNCYAIKNYGNIILSGAPILSGQVATVYTQDGASVSVDSYTGENVTVFYGDQMQLGTQTTGAQSVGDMVISGLTGETQAAKFSLVNPLRIIGSELAYDDAAKTLSLQSPFGNSATFSMTNSTTGAGTITITKDVTLTDTFEVKVDTTINLNGNNVTGADGKSVITVSGGTLKVTDNSTGTSGAIVAGTNGTGISTTGSGKVTVDTDITVPPAPDAHSHCVCGRSMESCTDGSHGDITSNKTLTAADFASGAFAMQGGGVYVLGGKITSTNGFTLSSGEATLCLNRNLLERQREGIAIAKREGKYQGRRAANPPEFADYYPKWQQHEISKSELARLCNVSRPTIDKLILNAPA